MSRRGRGDDARSRWAATWRLVAPYRSRMAVVAVLSFTGAVVEAAFLVLATRLALAIADDAEVIEVLPGLELSLVGTLLTGGSLVVVRLVVALASAWASTDLASRATSALRRRLAAAYLGAAWAVQQAEPAGRLQQLLQGFTSRATALISSVILGTSSLLSLAAILLVALVVDPLATAVVAVVLAVLGSVLSPLRHRVRQRARTAAATQLRFGNAIAELGALGLEMQSFGVRDQFTERVGRLIGEEVEASRRMELLRNAITPTYLSLAYLAILGGLALAASVGVAELADVSAVLLLMLRSLSYGQQMQGAAAAISAGSAFVETLDETMAGYERQPATTGHLALSRIGTVEAEAVSFAYEPGRPVLHDVSFRVEPGEVVGVVGPSGGGKSTLVQLLLGLREPTDGTIRFDGVDLRQVDRASIARRVAFVPQDPLLFTGTIAENVAFFREWVDEDGVRSALGDAELATVVASLPDGIHASVGERGGRLSGGQRQRLCIARALAGRPDLLVLDEPTSSLDVGTEASIRDTLAGLRGAVTVVVIAHRLSTLDVCDRILVIDGGRLLASGSPAELARERGFYRTALERSEIR